MRQCHMNLGQYRVVVYVMVRLLNCASGLSNILLVMLMLDLERPEKISRYRRQALSDRIL